MKTQFFRAAVSAVSLFALGLFASAQTYQITDLGALAGAPTYATAINDNGVACGYAQPDANTTRAWVFASNALTELPGLGGSETRAVAVGMDGKVYGYCTDAAGLAHAVRWENGVLTDLGPASGADGWLPQSVNAAGVIAGHTGSLATPALGFKLDGATFTPLGTLPGATPPATSAAYDLNDAGTMVGVASWVGAGTRAFRTDAAGALVSIGTLGANDSFAAAIDTAGNVAGYSVNAANELHAFYFTDAAGMKDLGVLSGGHESRAFGLNDSGYVVGMAENSAGESRAILWPGSGAFRDLNEVIPPTSGWTLSEAQDINAGGDIVGYGTVGGQTHAFLLERYEGADTLAPIAVGTATPPSNGATTTTVTVKFWDNEKVVTNTTHSVGTIRIAGPNLYDMPGTAFSWWSTDAQQFVVSFNVPAPGGTWSGAENGTYEIRLAPNQVSDLAGNLSPGGVIGTFTVGIQTAPVLNWITLPTTATVGIPVSLSFGAFGSYPFAAGDLFTVAVDWDGDGAVSESFPGLVSNATIAHTFTGLGTHTVRVRVTDPHGLQSSERTAQIAVSNAPLPPIAETIATQIDYFSSMNAVAAAVKGGTMYFFGGNPTVGADLDAPIVTWNYATPGAQFTFAGSFTIGPDFFEGAAVDGRQRVIMWGGYTTDTDAGYAPIAGARSYAPAGGSGSGTVAAMPLARLGGVPARDATGRIYSISGQPGTNFRYTAGTPTAVANAWSILPDPPVAFTPSTACFDGSSRVIVWAASAVWAFDVNANTWTQLPTSTVANPRSAVLGADGFIYLFSGTGVWTFDPVTNTAGQLGTMAFNHDRLPTLLGTDGYVYLAGTNDYLSYGAIERIDTRPGATGLPRVASTPTGTTVVQGNPWTYQISASGKPRPTYSIVRGPSGMTINATTGLVTWTPTVAQVGAQFALVRASNSVGAAEQIITFNVLAVPPDITAPTAPTNLVAFNINTNSADISWTASTDNIGVTGYRIFQRRTAYRGRGSAYRVYYSQIGATAGTSWHFANQPQCSTRTYYVSAIDAAGNLSVRTAITFTLQCPPSIYADNSGTFNGLRAIVSEPWTSNIFTAVGNPMPVLSVTSAPAGAVWHATTASTGYFTWAAVAGQEGVQTFTVGATSSAGTASFSRSVTVYPAGTDLIPPSAPGNFVVDQVSGDSCRVTWSTATDNYGIALYQVSAVHRQPRRRFHHGSYNDHVVTFTVPAGATQTVIPGLHASTSYVVSVTAQDTAGLWGYSASTNITTLPQPFVLASGSVTNTANADGSMMMTWLGYGYYWKFTVQCTPDLVTWVPVEPASQWPSFITTFTFTPEPGVAQRFYRVLATPATP